jgi:hypothetical protein
MARLTIENGTATRIFFNGKGVEVTEQFKDKSGDIQKRTYTAWFQEPVEFDLGATGKFSGLLAVKIRDWTDSAGNPVISKATGKQGQSADISLNNTTFTSASAEPNKKPATAIGGWGNPAAAISGDEPF